MPMGSTMPTLITKGEGSLLSVHAGLWLIMNDIARQFKRLCKAGAAK
jgi:hypothetical protein